jgi:hypothetical protein
MVRVGGGLSIPDPDPDFFPVPDPWVKKAPDAGSLGQKGTGSRIRNTANHSARSLVNYLFYLVFLITGVYSIFNTASFAAPQIPLCRRMPVATSFIGSQTL